MKRKTLFFLLGLLFLVPLSLRAYDFKSGDLYYNITSNTEPYTVEVTYETHSWNCYPYLTIVVIPEMVTYNGITYSVTSIGEYAFYGCKNLTSVTIPECVTSIKESAFSQCTGLTSITIPESVTSIGYRAFDGVLNIIYHGSAPGSPWSACSVNGYVDGYLVFDSEAKTKLVACLRGATGEIIIPESVTSIGSSAFFWCSLTSVTIPESVTSIGNNAFFMCRELTSVTWNAKNCEDFSYASESPFYCWQVGLNITSFIFGDGVEHIPANLCSKLEKLDSITIPHSVTSIGRNVFVGCSSLKTVVWNAKKCGDCYRGNTPFYYAYDSSDTPSITSFTFGDEVEHIPAYLCSELSELTSITLPDSVKTIGRGAFSNSGITEIHFPKSLTSIGYDVLEDCPVNCIIASMTTPVSLHDNMIGNDQSPKDVSLVVPQSSVSSYKSATYWKDFAIKTQTFSSYSCTTQTTAKVEVIYLTADNASHGRLGYVFAGDTIWDNDKQSDSVSFLIEGLAPSTDYEFCLLADSVLIGDDTEKSTYSQCSSFRTQSVGFNINANTTQTTARISLGIDCGDIPAIEQCGFTYHRSNQDDVADTIFFACTELIATLDTLLTSLYPNTEYNITPFVDINGTRYFKETSDYFSTRNISVSMTCGTPTQSAVPVTFTYDFGDADALNTGVNGIEYCLGSQFTDDSDIQTIQINSADSSLPVDTIICNLNCNAQYVFRPYVEINTQKVYGQTMSASTKDIGNIVLTTNNTTQTRVAIHLAFDKGDAVSKGAYGIQYNEGTSIKENYQIIPVPQDSVPIDTIIAGLKPNTDYVFRAFWEYGEKNSSGTASVPFEGTWEIDSPWSLNGSRLEMTTLTSSSAYARRPIYLREGITYRITMRTYQSYQKKAGYTGSLNSYVTLSVAGGSTRLNLTNNSGYKNDTLFVIPNKTDLYYLTISNYSSWGGSVYGIDLEVSNISVTKILSSTEKATYSSTRQITTLPVSLSLSPVAVGQTYIQAEIHSDYGDVTLERDVVELSMDTLQEAIQIISITDTMLKVNNLIPDTTYFCRHVLEFEWGLKFNKFYDFENAADNANWHFINGEESNKWVINTDVGSNSGGTNALYVSSGTSYSYSNTTSTVWAYCDDVLSGTVTISFDWKGTGESSYDYMYAYLVPVNASQPTAGSTTVPEGTIQIGSRFNGQSSWTTFTDEGRTLTGQYRLYFMWHNDGSTNGSPIAIDNIRTGGARGSAGNIQHTTDWQEFTTKPITLTTQTADGISNTSALLHGTVDCDQESYTEIGFEWKRSDAPATVKPQRLLVTDRVDENLLFRLEGLSSDRYYDFRTFCSYQGETYYGEWVGLLTSDKEVLVAPTVQTVGATANEQGAEMEGFIVTGTEPILQKGFEVWIKGGTDVKTTVAEGSIIRALIPEPWSYTTYRYKAYAKTASGTTYGETMEVTTGYIPRDVQDIAVTPSSNSAEVTWTEIEVADYYILTLFADEAMTDTVAVYQVGTDGGISRLRMPSAVKALVTCSIEDLTPATDYYFAVVAYNGADQKVAEESGTFATEPDPTGIRQTTDEPSPAVRKILYRGQVLILRNGKTYTLTGQEIR